MNIFDFRDLMNSFRQCVDGEGTNRKDSYFALDRMFAFYRDLDGLEKQMANLVLSEWLLSSDENLRFDALALVKEFHLLDTTAALLKLAERLRDQHEPGSPYELKKVQKLLVSMGE